MVFMQEATLMTGDESHVAQYRRQTIHLIWANVSSSDQGVAVKGKMSLSLSHAGRLRETDLIVASDF